MSRGVSVQGSLCKGGGSVQGVSVKGVSVRETPLYSNVRAVCILLECILGVFLHSKGQYRNCSDNACGYMTPQFLIDTNCKTKSAPSDEVFSGIPAAVNQRILKDFSNYLKPWLSSAGLVNKHHGFGLFLAAKKFCHRIQRNQTGNILNCDLCTSKRNSS